MRLLAPALFLLAFCAQGQTWVQLPDFPGTARDDAASFRIGDTIYVGTGMEVGWGLTNDWWGFNVNTETWAPVTPLPATPRQYCTGFFFGGDRGYLFGGIDANGPLNELWMYDQLNAQWYARAPLPDSGRYACASFTNYVSAGANAFVCGGMLDGGTPTNEVWMYDPFFDNWTPRAPVPGVPRHRAAGMNMPYPMMAGGADSAYAPLTDAYRYDETTNTWSPIAALPQPRLDGNAAGRLFVGGMDTIPSDSVWYYAEPVDSWTAVPFPAFSGGPRRGGITAGSFSSNTTGRWYFGTGSDNIQRYKDWWRLDLSMSITESEALGKLRLYPDPAAATVTLRLDPSMQGGTIEVHDMCGRTLLIDRANGTTQELNVSTLSNGGYVVTVRSDRSMCSARLIVQH